ncbi:hypothetical protein KR026_007179 [Drosophila bipectinata]|nr:hypothetical protein KR026_007179 [Drosophila bipectinata]
MAKKAKTIKEEYESQELLSLDEPIIYPPEFTVKMDNTASSNEESGEETAKDGHQDRKNWDSFDPEMDEKAEREMEEADVRNKDTEEDLRQMNELSLLSTAAMIAYIQGLESQLFELGQREARELTRSKHLRIFGAPRRRSNK